MRGMTVCISCFLSVLNVWSDGLHFLSVLNGWSDGLHFLSVLNVWSDCLHFLSVLNVWSDGLHFLSVLNVWSDCLHFLSVLNVWSDCLHFLSVLNVWSDGLHFLSVLNVWSDGLHFLSSSEAAGQCVGSAARAIGDSTRRHTSASAGVRAAGAAQQRGDAAAGLASRPGRYRRCEQRPQVRIACCRPPWSSRGPPGWWTAP